MAVTLTVPLEKARSLRTFVLQATQQLPDGAQALSCCLAWRSLEWPKEALCPGEWALRAFPLLLLAFSTCGAVYSHAWRQLYFTPLVWN